MKQKPHGKRTAGANASEEGQILWVNLSKATVGSYTAVRQNLFKLKEWVCARVPSTVTSSTLASTVALKLQSLTSYCRQAFMRYIYL